MSTENTGRLVTTTLRQLALDFNGNIVETGATKTNIIGEEDYIPPVVDYEACPLPTTTTTSTTTTSSTTTTTTTLFPNYFHAQFIPLGFSGLLGSFTIKRNNFGTPDTLGTKPIDSLISSDIYINRNAFTPIVASYFIIVPITTNTLSGQYDCVITQGGILGVGAEIDRQSINIGATPTLSFFVGAEVNYNDVYIQLQLMATTTTSTTSTTTSTTTTSTTTTTTTVRPIPPSNFTVTNESDEDVSGTYNGPEIGSYSTGAHNNYGTTIISGAGYNVVLNNDSSINSINYNVNGNVGTLVPNGITFINALTTPIVIVIIDTP